MLRRAFLRAIVWLLEADVQTNIFLLNVYFIYCWLQTIKLWCQSIYYLKYCFFRKVDRSSVRLPRAPMICHCPITISDHTKDGERVCHGSTTQWWLATWHCFLMYITNLSCRNFMLSQEWQAWLCYKMLQIIIINFRTAEMKCMEASENYDVRLHTENLWCSWCSPRCNHS